MKTIERLKATFLKQNVSNKDRAIRIAFAGVMVALFFTKVLVGIIGILALVRGAVFLTTAVLAFCPVYWLFNINTRLAKQKVRS